MLKLDHVILIICIVITLTLSLTVYNKSQNLPECSECKVVLKQQSKNYRDTSAQYQNKYNVSIYTLYEGLYYNKCPIGWDNVNGYIK